MKKIVEAKHMEESFHQEEKHMDNAERLIARKGLNKSSLWLPNNLLCNSRYYEDPELRAKYTSEPRTLKGKELEKAKAEILATHAAKRR